MFWKMVLPLMEKYYLIIVDLLGMGASSRPRFKFTSAESDAADEFLVKWIEDWRLKMGGLTGFILGGHSFGGYVCGMYASKYPQHIKKLMLFSPFGVPNFPENFNIDEEFEKVRLRQELDLNNKKRKFRKPPKCLLWCVMKSWGKNCNPLKILRCCGRGCT